MSAVPANEDVPYELFRLTPRGLMRALIVKSEDALEQLCQCLPKHHYGHLLQDIRINLQELKNIHMLMAADWPEPVIEEPATVE